MDNTTQALEPELPKYAMQALSKWPGFCYYSADQMRAYALAAIEADRTRRSAPAAQEVSDEINELKRQLVEYKTKHEVACSTLEIVKEQRSAAQKALALQCKETKELRALLAAAPKVDAKAAVPEGFVVAPKEPTQEMFDAGYEAGPSLLEAWTAMIATAPCGQQQNGEG